MRKMEMVKACFHQEMMLLSEKKKNTFTLIEKAVFYQRLGSTCCKFDDG